MEEVQHLDQHWDGAGVVEFRHWDKPIGAFLMAGGSPSHGFQYPTKIPWLGWLGVPPASPSQLGWRITRWPIAAMGEKNGCPPWRTGTKISNVWLSWNIPLKWLVYFGFISHFSRKKAAAWAFRIEESWAGCKDHQLAGAWNQHRGGSLGHFRHLPSHETVTSVLPYWVSWKNMGHAKHVLFDFWVAWWNKDGSISIYLEILKRDDLVLVVHIVTPCYTIYSATV